MEYANVVVDDFHNFTDFSKVEEINSFTNEVVKKSSPKQDVVTKVDNLIISAENIATAGGNIATSQVESRL